MIDFSISSVNMAILVSNLFIIFLVLIFRNRKIMFRLGLPLLVGFVILICVRMIFPVELLSISHNVYLPDLLATIVGETRRVRFFHDTVSWWNIFEIVWGCGILYSLLQYIKRNYDCQKYIRKHAVILSDTSIPMQAFTQITSETTKKGVQKISLLALPPLKSPVIYGLRRPCILIPDALKLSETEWRYVLLHEVNHYLHKDLYIKFLLQIICMIYWWNPFCRFLKNDTDTILEMRIDQTLADTPAHKVEYLSCLLKTASYQGATPKEAEEAFNRNQKNYLDMGHMKIILLGKDLLENEDALFEFLNYLEEKPSVAGNIYVFSCEDVKALMSFDTQGGESVGDYLTGILENNLEGKPKNAVTLQDLYNRWHRKEQLPQLLEAELVNKRPQIRQYS